MRSFQTAYTELQNITGEDTAAQLTRFKADLNDSQEQIISEVEGKAIERTRNITTIADTGSYAIPTDVGEILSVSTYVSASAQRYIPTPVDDWDKWLYLQSLRRGSTDITEYFYRRGNTLLIWPDYSTAGGTIEVWYRKKVFEMSRADYTTGTIVTATAADETIVGSGTTWTDRNPVGEQWLRINQTAGDYFWYRVNSITNATNLELESKYLGTSIAAGSSTYTIGEFPSIPGPFHRMLEYRTLALYYDFLEESDRAASYWRRYDGGVEAGIGKVEGGLMAKLRNHDTKTSGAAFYPDSREGELISPEFESLHSINPGGSW